MGSGNFATLPSSSLYVPDLHDVWGQLAAMSTLEEFADVGKGFEHKSRDDPTMPHGAITTASPVRIAGQGLAQGFAGWTQQQRTDRLPSLVWLNLDPDV